MRQLLPLCLLMIMIAWPQLWLNSYGGVVVAWVLTGALMAWFEQSKLIFLKGLLVGAVVTTVIYFGFAKDRSGWVEQVLLNNGLSTSVAPSLFIIFNALNAAFCLMMGSSLVRLFRPAKAA